jgi:AhpD family alkylhydroperoxidase
MEPRINHPAMTLPGAMQALIALGTSAKKTGLPQATIDLVHLRASQINGCSLCVELHSRDLNELGESDERIFAAAAWREAPYYSDAERAALALAEAVTRLSDRSDPVPDELWDEVTRHYSEPELAALLVSIATVNVWNRLNAATKQVAGSFAG